MTFSRPMPAIMMMLKMSMNLETHLPQYQAYASLGFSNDCSMPLRNMPTA